MSICLLAINVSAKTIEYKVIGKIEEIDFTLSAIEENGTYKDFKLDFKDWWTKYPKWEGSTSTAYAPQVIFEDINNDKNNELIIILTTGHGTGINQQEVHVFHVAYKLDKVTGQRKVDYINPILIGNPIAIVYKNVKTNLSTHKAVIKIGNKITTVDVNIPSKDLTYDIGYGNILKYFVKDNQLISLVGIHLPTFGGLIGYIEIVYEYKDKMYQAKSIKYIKNF
jgi:hypothetical protein